MQKPLVKIDARMILQLLKIRHIESIFVPECKTGESQTGRFRKKWYKFDAWVTHRDWREAYIGYEIKCSKSDFKNDKKWREYLPYCTEFYFVCPYGLIQLGELPKEAGLIWTNLKGTRLIMKKYANFRRIEHPASLLNYILISRTKIVEDGYNLNKQEYWEQWLTHKKISETFGQKVGHALKEKYYDLMNQIRDQGELKARIKELEAELNKSGCLFKEK